jgi:PadR family transcriptional regulator, regulatory protein PadR
VPGDDASNRRLLQRCACEGGPPKNLLRPFLLLLLKEEATHGAEAFGFPKCDPGGVDGALRGMERDGLVRSSWETRASGPDRRRYELSAAAKGMVHAWAAPLADTGRMLEEHLTRYSETVAPAIRLRRSVGSG